MGKLNKPKVDKITGISPAIAIEQKVNNSNPRSTVGTSSEIYEYLKLLYSRIGKTISPVSNSEVKKDSVDSVLKTIKKFKELDKFLILSPKRVEGKDNLTETLETLKKQGFARIKINDKIFRIDEVGNYSFSKFDLVIVSSTANVRLKIVQNILKKPGGNIIKAAFLRISAVKKNL